MHVYSFLYYDKEFLEYAYGSFLEFGIFIYLFIINIIKVSIIFKRIQNQNV